MMTPDGGNCFSTSLGGSHLIKSRDILQASRCCDLMPPDWALFPGRKKHTHLAGLAEQAHPPAGGDSARINEGESSLRVRRE
ncbi:unnamed protein product [Protopolystoma xenopodis]|uniref:Uncharacterized protein n=1 Tax=Protopolystoma xenopodis TaxID=117903 RepID=A0A3S5C0I0_9PLAT|nr:unnamed protein product [Protopolystoma xenopodis]